MTSDRRALRTGRSGKFFPGPVIVLQKAILDTDEMRALPANATKLLLSILPQYNGPGSNNGAIRILMRQPRRYGFKSGATLTQARDDLLRAGFLQVTLQGGKNIASLYAFTWLGIDEVPSIDVKADPTPSHLWRKQNAHQREIPVPRTRKARVLISPKNAKPAPVIGATDATTAPVLGACPPAIAPVIGAVRAKTGSRVAPVSGTDSYIAMRGAKAGVDVALEPTLKIDRADNQNQPVNGNVIFLNGAIYDVVAAHGPTTINRTCELLPALDPTKVASAVHRLTENGVLTLQRRGNACLYIARSGTRPTDKRGRPRKQITA